MSEHEQPGDAQEMSRDDLIREMARRLAATPVRDLLLQTMATFTDMAGVRLGYGPEGAQHRDLPQARLAIETLRALIAVADEQIGPAQARPFREPLAQLQMLYANEVEAQAAREESAGGQEPGTEESQDSGLWTPGGDEPGDASSRLWTPGSD